MRPRVSKIGIKAILLAFLLIWLITGLPVVNMPESVLVVKVEARGGARGGARGRQMRSRPANRRAAQSVQRRHHHSRPADRRPARGVHRRHHRHRTGVYVYSLSSDCRERIISGKRYYDCDGVYYQPYYRGNDLVYAEVENPR